MTWKPETDTFFVVANSVHLLHEYSADFQTLIRTISLDNGPVDTEDVVYLGDNRFALVVEDNEVYVVTIDDSALVADMSASDVERYIVAAPPANANSGFEGVTLRPEQEVLGEFFVCQEGDGEVPIRVMSFPRASAAGSYSYEDGTLVVSEPWDAVSALGSEAADLSGIAYDGESQTLLILSHESSRILRVVPESGEILEARDLTSSPQYEGLTYASGGRLVLLSEPGWVEIYQL